MVGARGGDGERLDLQDPAGGVVVAERGAGRVHEREEGAKPGVARIDGHRDPVAGLRLEAVVVVVVCRVDRADGAREEQAGCGCLFGSASGVELATRVVVGALEGHPGLDRDVEGARIRVAGRGVAVAVQRVAHLVGDRGVGREAVVPGGKRSVW